jgi:hypothetical protein
MTNRWLLIVPVIALLSFGGAINAKDNLGYMGMTKRQLVARLGLPAEITLETGDAPSREIWWYYWQDPHQGLTTGDFHFCGDKVCGFVSDFDEKRLVSTETADGFRRVYDHVAKERRKQRR